MRRSSSMTVVAAWGLMVLAGCAQPTIECPGPGECGGGPDPDPADGGGDGDGDGDQTQRDAGPEPEDLDSGPAVDGSADCATVEFEVTETQEHFLVPDGVRYMAVKAWGAGGNGEGVCDGDDSGLGGFTEAAFEVVPGTPLIVIVGKRGRAGITNEEVIRFGFGSWGGGGLSGIFRGDDPITEADGARALIIAGGGGSAGAPDCAPGGTGNAPEAGGQATMLGSSGADDINGGGGGFSGGTGGARGEPGLGGSGFVDPSALDSVMLSSERGSGTAPRSDDADYNGVAGTGEQSGLIVLHFTCEPPDIF